MIQDEDELRALRPQMMVWGAEADAQGCVGEGCLAEIARRAWWGATIPTRWGGLGWSAFEWGRLHAEIGRGCSATRGLLTLQAMVAEAIVRWGSAEAREAWLPRLASGAALGALALSEAQAGSDPTLMQTRAEVCEGGYALTGEKRWISWGERAAVLLVFARLEGAVTGFLVPAESAGLRREAMEPASGVRGLPLAVIRLDRCVVLPHHRLGGGALPGLGLVANATLELGRLSVAWGCVGILDAALDAALGYVRARTVGAGPLHQQPSLQRLLSLLAQDARAARLLCEDAARKRDLADPDASVAILIAKRFCAAAAARAASEAQRLCGAYGQRQGSLPERLRRDAAVMEIIEGPAELLDPLIAQSL